VAFGVLGDRLRRLWGLDPRPSSERGGCRFVTNTPLQSCGTLTAMNGTAAAPESAEEFLRAFHDRLPGRQSGGARQPHR
jgi:hypothetical protein